MYNHPCKMRHALKITRAPANHDVHDIALYDNAPYTRYRLAMAWRWRGAVLGWATVDRSRTLLLAMALAMRWRWCCAGDAMALVRSGANQNMIAAGTIGDGRNRSRTPPYPPKNPKAKDPKAKDADRP